MEISLPAHPVPVAEALVEASAVLGIPRALDLNGKTMKSAGGCGIPNVTVRGERERVSVASAYVRPFIGRPNLTVALHTRVDRLRMQGKRVTGVELTLADGSAAMIEANCEVILSAGAINTPKILMLSGIGDGQQLKAHGISMVQHLPGVGRNFQDHILVAGCVWEYVTPEAPRNNSAEFTFFCKSNAALATPDLQPVLEECAFGSEITRARYGLPSDPSVAWTLAPGLVRPESRGHVALTGRRPQDRMAIHANFLSDERDVTALVKAIELCREIGNSPLLRPFVRRELMPGPLRGDALVSFLRDAAGTYFHQTCTARMGRDAMSVVDAQLKVYGIDGLRIADGSIMPAITTGNTMAPCVMIGEQAADLIRHAHGLAAARD
jgi:choline dehydrogenase